MQENEQYDTQNPKAPDGLPVGANVRVGRLDDLPRIRAEASRLYREARRRHGRHPDALTAQRLSHVLASVRTLLEVGALADRLERLETLLAAREQGGA